MKELAFFPDVTVQNAQRESPKATPIRQSVADPTIIPQWRITMIRSPIMFIGVIFVLVVAVSVYFAGDPQAAAIIVSLCTLAGVAINTGDKYLRDKVMSKKLEENTELTRSVPAKVAAAVPEKVAERIAEKTADKIAASAASAFDSKKDLAEVVAEKSSDAFTKGFTKGAQLEREKQEVVIAGLNARIRELESKKGQ